MDNETLIKLNYKARPTSMHLVSLYTLYQSCIFSWKRIAVICRAFGVLWQFHNIDRRM